MNDEQITFGAYLDGKGGICIPLTMETILDAMQRAYYGYRHGVVAFTPKWRKRHRQKDAFRTRILRMDAEKDDDIEALNGYVDEAMDLIEQHYNRAIKAERRIVELEGEIECIRSK